MSDLRSFIGSRCPHCAQDILQPAPETARMPIKDRLSCLACGTVFRLADLEERVARGGFLARLFARPDRRSA
ncbi:MAG TPA: hypothetical protein VM889_05480 [Candidatus Thermoplasmatota archaeon]|nr:hypothetical protein [Candidatus Thermoplasmatota archaeon]